MTRGPLKCVAARGDGASVKATFSGAFMGEGFEYRVNFTSQMEGTRVQLKGTATLDGDRYEWSGYVQGATLIGKFQSLKGNNGTFRLRRQ